MEVFKWNSDYSVGVDVIDNQHKVLVSMLSELLDAMKQGKGNNILLPILQSLTQYTLKHFDMEEKLMDKYHYPGAGLHKQEHAKLKTDVNKYMQKYSETNASLPVELMNFLINWLKNHILGTDKKFGKFLSDKTDI